MINLEFCDSKFIISISTELTRVGQRFVTFVKKMQQKKIIRQKKCIFAYIAKSTSNFIGIKFATSALFTYSPSQASEFFVKYRTKSRLFNAFRGAFLPKVGAKIWRFYPKYYPKMFGNAEIPIYCDFQAFYNRKGWELGQKSQYIGIFGKQRERFLCIPLI